MSESDGQDVDNIMKNNIEGIIIKWAHQVLPGLIGHHTITNMQVDEVLSQESDQELEEGKHPGPRTEIEFWESKCQNLESLFEQVRARLLFLPSCKKCCY